MLDLTNFLNQYPVLFLAALILMVAGSILDLIQSSFLFRRWLNKRIRILYQKVKRELLFEQFQQKGKNETQKNDG